MERFVEKYVNPFTDFGFKKIFGEEVNKDLLMDFLNELLKKEQGRIVELTYLKSEHLGDSALDRKAIFDLYCTNESGERFIVELQKTKQKFFKDRAVYYSTFAIREQANRAQWDYRLDPVYTIAILDFVFDEHRKNKKKYRYDVKLMDIEENEVFYDKLTFIYLEMPKFDKPIEKLRTRFEKWVYLLKNLTHFDHVPEQLRESLFEKLFETAEIAKFSPEQLTSYEDSLKVYRDIKNSIDTAREEGREEGIEIGVEKGIEIGLEKGKIEGKAEGEYNKALEIARNLKANGLSTALIAQSTGLSLKEIENL